MQKSQMSNREIKQRIQIVFNKRSVISNLILVESEYSPQ